MTRFVAYYSYKERGRTVYYSANLVVLDKGYADETLEAAVQAFRLNFAKGAKLIRLERVETGNALTIGSPKRASRDQAFATWAQQPWAQQVVLFNNVEGVL